MPTGSDNFQEQFSEAWGSAYTEAENKFSDLTNRYLKDARNKDGRVLLRRNVTFGDLDQQLHSISTQGQEDREKHSRWTQAMLSAARPIERLGGLVSGVVSAAFPAAPTGLAFNAISYLITTGHEVSDSYDTLAALFEEIREYLARIGLNADRGIPRQLLDIFHQVLISTIVISALAIRLLKQKIWKTYIKQAFLGDDGEIRAQLVKMKKFADYDIKMVNALTLHEVRDIKFNLEDMFKYFPELKEDVKDIKTKIDSQNVSITEVLVIERKRESNTNHRRQLENMRSGLNAQDNKATEANRQALGDIELSRLPDTGVWLADHSAFKLWLQEQIPVLVIYGDRGTGKSHVAANVLSHLVKTFPQDVQAASEISVLGHFFNSNKIFLQDLKKALQAMAYKVAENDTVFANHFEHSCKSFNELQDVDDIWDKAFKGFFSSQSYTNRAYVVIDGSDQLKAPDRKLLMKFLKDVSSRKSDEPRLRLQFLICETPAHDPTERFERYLGKNTPIVHLDGKANAPDLKAFVTTRVDQVKSWIRWGLRDEIIEKVVTRSGGRYESVDLQLNDLKSKRRAKDITEALKTPAQEVPAAIRAEMQRLGEDLEQWEQDDVWKLLTWLVYGFDNDSFTLVNVKDILDFGQDEATDIASLEEQLRERYNSIFDIVRVDEKTTDDLKKATVGTTQPDQTSTSASFDTHGYNSNPESTRVLVKDSVRQYFLDQDFQIDTQDSSAIRAAELKIVKRFLDLVCDEAMLTRLGFDKVLSQERQEALTAISIDRKRSYRELAETTMRIITTPNYWERYSADENSFLADHAIRYFPGYLNEMSFESLSVAEAIDITEMVVLILRDEEVIRRWARDNRQISPAFLNANPWYEDLMISYCESIKFTASLNSNDKDWLKSILSNDGKVQKHLLWKPLIDVLIDEWLRNTKWNAESCYDAIRNYLDNCEPSHGKFDEQIDIEATHAEDGGKAESATSGETKFQAGNDALGNAQVVQLLSSRASNTTENLVLDQNKKKETNGMHAADEIGQQDAIEDRIKADGNVSGAGEDSTEAPRILAAALWTKSAMNSLWQLRVGQTLLYYCEYLEATKQFEAAVANDPQNWRAFRGLGKAFFEQGDRQSSALDAQEKALAAIETCDEDSKPPADEHAELLVELGDTLDALEQHDRAATIYTQALKLNSKNSYLVQRTLRSLDISKDYTGVLQVLRDLESTEDKGQWKNRLVAFYIQEADDDDVHAIAIRAARHTNQLDFVKQLYSSCIETASKEATDDEVGLLKLWFGKLLLTAYQQPEEARKCFEEVTQLSSVLNIGYRLRWARFQAVQYLANIYLDGARAAGPSSNEAHDLIDKLAHLSVGRPADDNDDSDSAYTIVGNVSLLLGRWYARWVDDKAEAQKYLKPDVVFGIKLLSDDVDWNDRDAYGRLAKVFMSFGDEENALAAWSALSPVAAEKRETNPPSKTTSENDKENDFHTRSDQDQAKPVVLANATNSLALNGAKGEADNENHQLGGFEAKASTTATIRGPESEEVARSESQPIPKMNTAGSAGVPAPDENESQSNQDEQSDGLIFLCDGECGRTWTTGEDIWHCKDSLSLDLCDSCYKLMRDDKLGFRVCNQERDEWLYVPKATARLQKDTVRYKDNILTLDEWKGMIKEEWGIS